MYFGDGDHVGRGDHDASLKALKEKLAAGGPFEGEDDGSGWIWVVADVNHEDGFFLKLYKSIPYGKRPMMVARQDNVNELFDKINWSVARVRLNRVLGLRDEFGKATRRKHEDAIDVEVMA
eukprot:TRINITY_DN23922_c0_g1_i2.p1 TRINITY_DN23922_c0_g1~~TRINITY_DN23922_c0_g1_i2.p1  ORF type:complete len:121 (-),score=26.52 TRINITY_DN23922_c0_g1_i2:66-428(-)